MDADPGRLCSRLMPDVVAAVPALAALEELDFPRGKQAMMWAECTLDRRMPDAMSKLQPIHRAASTMDRTQLDRSHQAAG